MYDIVELVRALAWPITALIILFALRPELLRLVGNLSRRVETATSVIIRPSGIEIRGEIKGPVPLEVQQRKLRFTNFVRNSSDKQVLDSLADVMNVPRSPNVRTQKGAINAEMTRRVSTNSDMDHLVSRVQEILGKDFSA
jgi:hypothetical protein